MISTCVLSTLRIGDVGRKAAFWNRYLSGFNIVKLTHFVLLSAHLWTKSYWIKDEAGAWINNLSTRVQEVKIQFDAYHRFVVHNTCLLWTVPTSFRCTISEHQPLLNVIILEWIVRLMLLFRVHFWSSVSRNSFAKICRPLQDTNSWPSIIKLELSSFGIWVAFMNIIH